MEPEKLNVYQRLHAIMAELDYIEKGKKTVNGQYRFVSHDQVTAKLHPLLVKHRVIIIPTVEKMTQDANRTVVDLVLRIINIDEPTDRAYITYSGYGVDSGDKGPGKAISYAFKYALLKLFCLETGDDPDNDANALYEPEKCLEFDSAITDEFGDQANKVWPKMDKFLKHTAQVTGKHMEDLKREALKKLPEFLAAFKTWTSKKKEEV